MQKIISKSKRALSWVLALALVLGMFPAIAPEIPMTAEAAAVNNTYDSGTYLNIVKEKTGLSSIKWINDAKYEEKREAIEQTMGWYVNKEHTTASVWNATPAVGSTRTVMWDGICGLVTELYEGEQFAIDIKVGNNEGWYDIGLLSGMKKGHEYANVEIYVLNGKGELTKIGRHGYPFMSMSTTAFNNSTDFEAVKCKINGYSANYANSDNFRLTRRYPTQAYLTSGTNTIIFKGVDKASDGVHRVFGLRQFYIYAAGSPNQTSMDITLVRTNINKLGGATGDFWVDDDIYTNNIGYIDESTNIMLNQAQTSDAVWNNGSRFALHQGTGIFTELYEGEKVGFNVYAKRAGWYQIGLVGMAVKGRDYGAHTKLSVLNGNGKTYETGTFGYEFISVANKDAFEAHEDYEKLTADGYSFYAGGDYLRLSKSFDTPVYLTSGVNTLIFEGTENKEEDGRRILGVRLVDMVFQEQGIEIEKNKLFIKQGETVKNQLKLKIAGNYAQSQPSDFTVTKDNDNVNVEVLAQDGGTYLNITGVKAGDAVVTVSSGEAEGVSVNVRVAPETGNLIYDFTKAYLPEHANSVAAAAGVNYDMTTRGSAKELNAIVMSEPWEHYSHAGSYFRYVDSPNRIYNGIQNYGLNIANGIKIKVDKAGTYYPVGIVGGEPGLSGVCGTVWLEDLDGKVLATSKSVNSTLNEAPIRAQLLTPDTADDDGVNLEAGEYVVYWRADKKAPGWEAKSFMSMYMKGFQLLTQEYGKDPSNTQGIAGANDDLTYDFTALRDEENVTQAFMNSISYSKTLAAGSPNAWMPYSWHMSSAALENVQYNQVFCYFNTWADIRGLSVRGHTGSLKVHVPKTGYYMPTVKFGTTNANGNNHKVYLYKLNASEAFEEELVYTTINTKSRATQDYLISQTPIYMEAGEYALVFHTQHSIVDSLKLDALDMSLNCDISSLAIKPGETHSDVLMNITDESGAAVDFTGGETYVVVEDSSVADFDVSIASDGKAYYTYTGKKHANTNATITVIDASDRAYMQTIKLCVNPEGLLVGEDVEYNFKKLGDNTKITEVTDFAMTTAGSDAEINPTVATAPWRYILHKAQYFKYEDSVNGLFLGNTNASATFGIRLDGDSVYQLVSTHTTQPNGGKVDVYLAPVGVGNVTADDYYMGALDTYGAIRTPNQTGKLKMKYLSRGDYILTYKLNGAGASLIPETRFDFTGITFKAMDANTVVNVSAVMPDSIPIGQTVEVPLTVTENSGGESWNPKSTITASANPSDILSFEVVSDEEGVNHVLKITANKAGTAMVTVKAENEIGLTNSFSSPILVMNAEQMASRTYNYNFMKVLYENQNINLIDSYAKTLAGSGEEIRPGAVTDNWKYHSNQSSAFVYFSDTNGVNFSQVVGQYVAFSIRLPESGIFRPVMTYTAQHLGGNVRLFIAPSDEEDFRADKWAVGDFDSWRESTKYSYKSALRTRYLTAGEYIVALELIDSNPNLGKDYTPRLWFQSFQLQPVEAHPEINVVAPESVELNVGGLTDVSISAAYADESAARGDATDLSAESLRGATYNILSGGEYVAIQPGAISKEGTLLTFVGLKEGAAEVEVEVILGGERRATFKTNVTVGAPAVLAKITTELPGYSKDTLNLRDLNQPDAVLDTRFFDDSGKQFTQTGLEILGGANCVYTSSDESVATVDNNGVISPISPGRTTISLSATLNGVTQYAEIAITVAEGKSCSTFYDAPRIANARENIKKFDWARREMTSAVKAAEKYLDESVIDHLWDSITTQEIPRSYYVGYRGEPAAEMGTCRYCGVQMASTFGNATAWIIDVINSPWKVQCPACRRKFPSNDFSKFYQAGLDEHHVWRYEQAKANASHTLTNDLHPEKGAGWGVDDGYGYVTGRTAANGVDEVHTYISYYNQKGIWENKGAIVSAIDACVNAYNYTGDVKYARAGAILVDRVTDIWKDLVYGVYSDFTTAAGNYEPLGRAVDWIWENGRVQQVLKGYDAFYDAYDDPYVIKYINEKAKQYNYYGMENHKETANQIREHIEDNTVRMAFESCKDGNINGNFGMPQNTAVIAGIVLDTQPETDEMFDWAFRTGVGTGGFLQYNVTGGNINEHMINEVDRDGQTHEVAPQYTQIWTGGLSAIIDNLANYGDKKYNMYNNPKVIKMLWSPIQTAMANGGNVALGDDNNGCGGNVMPMSTLVMGRAWQNTKIPLFAQLAYYLNGNSTAGLTYDIFTKNPESFATEVQQVIDTYGEYNTWKTDVLPGFGLIILRRGEEYASAGKADVYNTKGDFWFHYGYNGGHGQPAALNLGVEAYGLNMAPEFGYPPQATGDEFSHWGEQSLSHNLVVVNDVDQTELKEAGNLYHVEDAGRVKIMDADADEAYASRGVTDYRRTVVMIEANDEVSYGIDFFRVVGGASHMYSFHAMSDHLAEAPVEINGDSQEPRLVPLVAQKDPVTGEYKGTYAGIDVPYKTPNISSGFSYLKNIDKAINPRISEFAVDFAITDFRNDITLDSTEDLHLRLSMLNDSEFEEITIATGSPADRNDNPQNLKFLLARNNDGESLFTTVIEPYATERYIEKTEQMTDGQLTYADGSAVDSEDVVKVVKVTFVDGRIDYVFYSLDNSKEYLLTDGDMQIPFSGFVGVYTLDANGAKMGSYLHDGTKLADVTTTDAYTGYVVNRTETLEFENFIEVAFDNPENVDTDNLLGRFIFFNNTAYEIKGVQVNSDTVTLNVGDSTFIKSMDLQENLTYFVDIGDEIRIPLSVSTDTTPVFDETDNGATVIVGHEYTSYVSATSPVGKELTYEAVSLPRGATFDAETGKINWKPDSYQVGKHHFGIRASDGDLSSVLSFTVEVYKSSSGSGNLSDITGEVTPSAPSGGSAGGGSTTPSTPTQPDEPEKEDTPKEPEKDDTPDTPIVPDTPAEKFVDLGNHTWAKDSIYSLVDKGVVNGTSANTYAPANNIKRADFAIMLVRAFGITEGEGENFADVDANKYYADELRLAKANGIVNGVGEDKFNPEGEITRQDMMLMLSRALDAMEVELSDADREALADFADAAEISDYAADAVSRMIKDGFITGANGKINPLAKATRAEIAVMLDRVLAK